MKLIYVLFISCLSINISAQSLEMVTSALKAIDSLDQIEELRKKYPNWNIYSHTGILSDSLDYSKTKNANIGDYIRIEPLNNIYAPTRLLKVLEIGQEEVCRVKSIYLNGYEFSKVEIDSIRDVIIEKYRKGTPFESLFKEYNMDGNKTGDYGWFYKGKMVEEFDSAVRRRKKGDIFTIDIDKNKWYYVVLKNHENKFEKAVKGIKIDYE